MDNAQDDDDAVVAANLRVCSVKLIGPPEVDRRFCFQVVSPARTYILQGLSEDDVNQWITLLQAAISAALTAPASANDDSAEIGLSRDRKERLSKDAITALAIQRAAQRAAQLRLQPKGNGSPAAAQSAATAAAPSPLSADVATEAPALAPFALSAAAAGSNAVAPTTPSAPAEAVLTAEQVQAIRDRPGNNACADCGTSRACRWPLARAPLSPPRGLRTRRRRATIRTHSPWGRAILRSRGQTPSGP